jgi:hypothetical protein
VKTEMNLRVPKKEHDIKMNRKEMGCENVEWINLARDRTPAKFLSELLASCLLSASLTLSP